MFFFFLKKKQKIVEFGFPVCFLKKSYSQIKVAYTSFLNVLVYIYSPPKISQGVFSLWEYD